MPTRPRTTGVLAAVGAIWLLAAGCGASGGSQPSRRIGLQSIFEAQVQLLGAPAATLDRLRRLGVDTVRVSVPWSSLAPDPGSRVPPRGFQGASATAYSAAAWAPYDAIARDAAARGITLYLNPTGPAPRWATGPGAPRGAPSGVWKPSAAQFGAFVRALASRYSGTYRPPGARRPLPRVSFWSVWNEPNYGVNLAPQAIDHSTVEVAPSLYRQLVDSAWAALQQTGHGRDTILIGELAPRGITVGNSPGNFSGMVPLRFLRALYCVDSSFSQLRGAAAAARSCPSTAAASADFRAENPALFEASGVAAHLYPQGGLPPTFVTPYEPDYADLATLARLESTLDRLASAYGSTRRFPIYSTEFGYQTTPPEKIARTTNPTTAAFYLNWAEYISWRDPRVRSWDQFLLSDPPSANFATGLEFANGRPKPSFYAYRVAVFLPGVSEQRGKALEVWGCVRPARYARLRTHQAQVVSIQWQPSRGGGFRTIMRVTLTDPYGYFDVDTRFSSSGTVRLAWAYPGGPTILSRTVSIVVR